MARERPKSRALPTLGWGTAARTAAQLWMMTSAGLDHRRALRADLRRRVRSQHCWAMHAAAMHAAAPAGARLRPSLRRGASLRHRHAALHVYWPSDACAALCCAASPSAAAQRRHRGLLRALQPACPPRDPPPRAAAPMRQQQRARRAVVAAAAGEQAAWEDDFKLQARGGMIEPQPRSRAAWSHRAASTSPAPAAAS